MPIHFLTWELREFELKSETHKSRALIQTFPLLESFSTDYLSNAHFKDFLKLNQQLKSIGVDHGYDSSAYFTTIAKHLPLIENLSIFVDGFRAENDIDLSKLSALKKLVIEGDSRMIPGILNKAAAANIPIEFLELNDCISDGDVINSIPKLKSLKTLRLQDVCFISQLQLRMLCKYLPELSELYLESDYSKCENIVLEIVQNAENLQKLHVYMPLESERELMIDIEMYMNMLNILKSRPEKKRLDIVLINKFYSIDVPNELIKANKHLLTIEIKNVVVDEKTDDDADETGEESFDKENDTNYEKITDEETNEESDEETDETDEDFDYEDIYLDYD